jgi:hypothetical protein
MKRSTTSKFLKCIVVITVFFSFLSAKTLKTNALALNVCYQKQIAVGLQSTGYLYSYDIITFCVDGNAKLHDIRIRHKYTPLAYSAKVNYISVDGSGFAATASTSWYVTGFFVILKLGNISVKATTRTYRINNTGIVTLV